MLPGTLTRRIDFNGKTHRLLLRLSNALLSKRQTRAFGGRP
jgi:hypothetical protein